MANLLKNAYQKIIPFTNAEKQNFVAAHLRGMRPTSSRQKDTLMLREKFKL